MSPDPSVSTTGAARVVTTPAPSSTEDAFLYRMVVGSLGLALLFMVLGGLVLAGLGKAIPDGLIALGAMSGGALGGLLAPSLAR